MALLRGPRASLLLVTPTGPSVSRTFAVQLPLSGTDLSSRWFAQSPVGALWKEPNMPAPYAGAASGHLPLSAWSLLWLLSLTEIQNHLGCCLLDEKGLTAAWHRCC